MLIASLDNKEYLEMWSSDQDELFDFVSALFIGMTSTPPPPSRPKLHSFQARWCGQRVVGCWDLEEFEDWLLAHGDSIEHYIDVTHEFVYEYKIKCGPVSESVH